MLYGMETVAVTKRKVKKQEVAELKMLRSAKGVTLLDRVRNEEVLREMKLDKLDGVLREAKLWWFGHAWRKDDQYVSKQVIRITVGRQERGRPKRRWKDCVQEDKRSLGL